MSCFIPTILWKLPGSNGLKPPPSETKVVKGTTHGDRPANGLFEFFNLRCRLAFDVWIVGQHWKARKDATKPNCQDIVAKLTLLRGKTSRHTERPQTSYDTTTLVTGVGMSPVNRRSRDMIEDLTFWTWKSMYVYTRHECVSSSTASRINVFSSPDHPKLVVPLQEDWFLSQACFLSPLFQEDTLRMLVEVDRW